VASQWCQDYAFHLATFSISFVTLRGRTMSVESRKIDGAFDNPRINVIDVLASKNIMGGRRILC
jgi:hypothetical protein